MCASLSVCLPFSVYGAVSLERFCFVHMFASANDIVVLVFSLQGHPVMLTQTPTLAASVSYLRHLQLIELLRY